MFGCEISLLFVGSPECVTIEKFVILTPAAAMEDGGKTDSESGQEDNVDRSALHPPPQSRAKNGVREGLSRKGKQLKFIGL